MPDISTLLGIPPSSQDSPGFPSDSVSRTRPAALSRCPGVEPWLPSARDKAGVPQPWMNRLLPWASPGGCHLAAGAECGPRGVAAPSPGCLSSSRPAEAPSLDTDLGRLQGPVPVPQVLEGTAGNWISSQGTIF